MATMVSFLLVLSLLAGKSASESERRSNNGSQTESTFLSSEPKCLLQLDQVRDVLASTSPPISGSKMKDNFYNISRALFPSVSLPALYVKVTIQLLLDYQNGTTTIDDKKMKFTWSKACSYVSVKHISLNTMSVFSLFTIYPQRRATELVVTVPPFCKDSPYAQDDQMKANTWKYVVSTIEDIIMISKISDPRLNTAACVVIGHEGDITDYPPWWFFYWFILVASFLLSSCIWRLLFYKCAKNFINFEVDRDNQTKRDLRIISGAILEVAAFVAVIVGGIMFFSSLVTALDKPKAELIAYFIAYWFAYCFAFFFSILCLKHTLERLMNSKIIYKIGSYFLFPCLFQTVHYLLWVVCGIISDPYWAIPVFVFEYLFFLSIMYLAYFYEKDIVEREDPITSSLHVKIEMFFFWVSFLLLLIALIAISLIVAPNGSGVAVTLLDTVLSAVLVWLIKISKLKYRFIKVMSIPIDQGGQH